MSNHQRSFGRQAANSTLAAIVALLVFIVKLFAFVSPSPTNAATIAAAPTVQPLVARPGNQILAEAIFSDRKVIDDGGLEVITGNTWLIMLHRPGVQ